MRFSNLVHLTLAALCATTTASPLSDNTGTKVSRRDEPEQPVVTLVVPPCSHTTKNKEGLPRCAGYPENQKVPMTCKAKKKSNGKKGKKAKAYWQYEVDGIPQWINTPAQQWKSIQGHFDAQCPSYRFTGFEFDQHHWGKDRKLYSMKLKSPMARPGEDISSCVTGAIARAGGPSITCNFGKPGVTDEHGNIIEENIIGE